MIHFDLETRATVDLRVSGSHRYSIDPQTDVWCLCYIDSSTQTKGTWTPGSPPPSCFLEPFNSFCAWNAQFERNIHENILVPRYGFMPLDIDQWEDTAAWARQLGLPASLNNAGIALGLPMDKQKDKAGADVMRKLAKPKGWTDRGEPIWVDDADLLARLITYCETDVVSEMEIHRLLTSISQHTPNTRIDCYAGN